jgi:hypothetical protein
VINVKGVHILERPAFITNKFILLRVVTENKTPGANLKAFIIFLYKKKFLS